MIQITYPGSYSSEAFHRDDGCDLTCRYCICDIHNIYSPRVLISLIDFLELFSISSSSSGFS